MNGPVKTIQQHNRNAVIIHNVFYPLGSLDDFGMSGTSASSNQSNPRAVGRKLQKRRPSHLPIEELKPDRVAPIPLPADYLGAEETSRDATLIHVSVLSKSRSAAKQTQNREACSNAPEKIHPARSANMSVALSSHPVGVREAVSTDPGSDGTTLDTRKIKPALKVAHHTRRKGRKQSQVVRFADSRETTVEKCDHLEKERDRYISKCEELQRILDGVYGYRDVLRRELGSEKRKRIEIEKDLVDLRNRVRSLEAEAAVERAKLDAEIRKGLLSDVDIRRLRDENQRLKFRGEAFAAATHTPPRDYDLIPRSSPPDSVDNDGQPQTKNFGSASYSHLDRFRVTECSTQKTVEVSHQRLRDMQVGGRPAADGLINCRSSHTSETVIMSPAEPKAIENGVAQNRPQWQTYIHTPAPRARTATEALQQQTAPGSSDLVADHLPEFRPTPLSSSLLKEGDVQSVTLPTPNKIASDGENFDSRSPLFPRMSEQFPELDLGTSSADEDFDSIRCNTNMIFRFGSPKIREAPAVCRVRISPNDIERRSGEAFLIPNLDTWEWWSSVPELELWDPKCTV